MNFAEKVSLKFYTPNLIKQLVVNPGLLLSAGLASFGVICAMPQAVNAKPQLSPAEARLSKMFSREMQAIMAACAQRGGVNLAAGADRDGSVICGDGWRKLPVKYADYLNMSADLVGGGFLLGLRVGLQGTPEAERAGVLQILNTSEGVISLRTKLEQLLRHGIVPKSSPKSIKILSDRVIARVLPIMRNPTQLYGLLGTAEEYSTISQNFCTPPGMSIKQAKGLTPNLDGIQIYAICMQEAGLTDELMRQLR